MEDLIKWMNVGARHTAMHMDRVMAPYGLNASQYMYLVQVCEHPGLTQDRFLQQFYLNPSNVTRAMLALEKMGFLERRCKPPGPADLLRLSHREGPGRLPRDHPAAAGMAGFLAGRAEP